MTTALAACAHPSRRVLLGLRCALLTVGFALAVALRADLGGAGVAHSIPAGLAFAAVLLALTVLSGVRVRLSWGALAWGVAGGAVLCGPLLLRSVLWPGPAAPRSGFWLWAAAVTVVVLAEELFLRGALFEAVTELAGVGAAVLAGAVGFALLHVPLYGWKVVPLDLVVGVILGELRRASGSPTAPAVTHLSADVAAWFLR